ncbi:hypothetical protein [Streptomyces sp. CL12]|uniref:hypothetical protein n=1 Tax=Streptomyces sp. CL12 TaxID=3391744 RepID=UPI003A80BF17
MFWLIGGCFSLLGLLCFVAAFFMWFYWRKGEAKFRNFLLWLCGGFVGQALMVVFYTLKP